MTGKIRFIGDLSLFPSFNFFFSIQKQFQWTKKKSDALFVKLHQKRTTSQICFNNLARVFNNLITYQRLGKHLLSTPAASEKYTEAPQRFPKKYIGLAQTIIQLWLPYKLLF